MQIKVKTSKLILLIMAVLLIAFVCKMIFLFEEKGSVPDTLIQCVLGGGLAELGFTAWITVSKVKNKQKDNNDAEG